MCLYFLFSVGSVNKVQCNTIEDQGVVLAGPRACMAVGGVFRYSVWLAVLNTYHGAGCLPPYPTVPGMMN